VRHLCPFRDAWCRGVYPEPSAQFTLRPLHMLQRRRDIFQYSISISKHKKDISAKLLHLQQAYFSLIISLKTWSESWWCRDCVYYTHAKNAMRLSRFSRSPEDLKCCLEHTHTHTFASISKWGNTTEHGFSHFFLFKKRNFHKTVISYFLIIINIFNTFS